MANNTVVPYTVGKVKIGVYYQPPYRMPEMGAHAELLQEALIGSSRTWWQRLMFRMFGK